MYGNDFEIKVMRNTCKNHRAGKIGFPSKSSSQVRGCLSPTAIIRRDVFSLLSSLTPSPLSEVSAPCFTHARLQRFFQAAGCGLEEAGAGRAPLCVGAAARYATAARPPAGQQRCGGARPGCDERSARAHRAPRTRASEGNLTHKRTAES